MKRVISFVTAVTLLGSSFGIAATEDELKAQQSEI